jgi:DNA-binding transcriptional MocR family regulator
MLAQALSSMRQGRSALCLSPCFHRAAARAFASTTTSHRQDLRPFKLEQYDGWTKAPHSLTDSDCEPLLMNELLEMADDECRDMWENLSLAYPFWVQGHPLLREAIASQYERIDPDSINCLAPQEGIYCAMQALLQPGDHVIVAAPCYQSLSEVPRSIGCNMDYWLPEVIQDDEAESFRFDPARLETLLQSSRATTKLVVVNFPHNPTGALPTLSEWDDMVRMCEKHGAYLFCDEMYRCLEHDPASMLPAAADIYERGVSLSGELTAPSAVMFIPCPTHSLTCARTFADLCTLSLPTRGSYLSTRSEQRLRPAGAACWLGG